MFVSVAGVSCTASYPTEPTKAAPAALVIIQGARGRVPVGNSLLSFGAYTIDDDGAFEMVTDRATFEAADTGIVSPFSRGVFQAVGAGTTTITARFGGLTASVPIVVFDSRTVAYPRLVIFYTTPGTVGARAQSNAQLQRTSQSANENVSSQATWSSDNPQVATVDANGLITGVGIGTALISAHFEGLSDWYWLSIVPR